MLPNGHLVAGAENNKITVWDVDAGTSLISTGAPPNNATLTAHV
jgi:hypothetical protein